MNKIFDIDSPFMRFLNRVADLLILNLIVMVCCIPIVTAGAALTAMHYVLLKMVRGEEGYLFRSFFKSFKQNFKQATAIWLIILLFLAVFVGDVLVINYSTIEFPAVFKIVLVAAGVFVGIISTYVFPLLARFDNTVKNTVKNAALLAVANLPKTLAMVVFYILPLVIGYLSTYSYVFIFMFGLSLPAYAAAYLYSDIFKKFEPEEEIASDLEFSLKQNEENK
jgi:uncharacterized membrane protein YesL